MEKPKKYWLGEIDEECVWTDDCREIEGWPCEVTSVVATSDYETLELENQHLKENVEKLLAGSHLSAALSLLKRQDEIRKDLEKQLNPLKRFTPVFEQEIWRAGCEFTVQRKGDLCMQCGKVHNEKLIKGSDTNPLWIEKEKG